MTHGKEVMLRYRTKDSGGIPWYAILDSKGKELATADGPDGNIGYPFESKEIDQFLAIVRGQSRHLEASHLKELKKSLHDSAEKIKQAQQMLAPLRKKINSADVRPDPAVRWRKTRRSG